VVVDEAVQFGPVTLRVASNEKAFPALQYFSREARTAGQGTSPQFELWCISLRESDLDPAYLREHVDCTYRGASFLQGYYVTDHFGPPLYLVTRGQRNYVFGEQLEHVVWPYFVKYFLMIQAIKEKRLNLKAAAIVINSAGTLVLGRGGAGKTVFLTQLCRRGARFISNTHSLIQNGRVTGVASAMRVRPGSWFSEIAGVAESHPAIRPGEVIIDPYRIFDVHRGDPIEVKNLCVVDFRGPGSHTIETLTDQEVYNYAEQFSLAINVYRLEEDLLDFYKGDYRQFTQSYGAMKDQLTELVRRCRRYYISCDLLEAAYQDEVFDLLSA